MTHPEACPSPRVERIFNTAMGALLVACGGWVALALPATSTGEWLGAAGLGLVGGEALLAALRARRSWLSRIGPLP